MRGRQSNILRLASFDRLAFVHMLFYRISIFVSIIAAVLIVAAAFDKAAVLLLSERIAILVMWLLFTPQLFETAVAFSLIETRGRVFGHLNQSFLDSYEKGNKTNPLFTVLPYAAVTIWVISFVAFAIVVFA